MSLPPASLDHLTQVRDLLVSHGYTAAGLAARLSPAALAALQRDIPAVAALELHEAADAQALLIRCFQLVDPTPQGDWVTVLGAAALDLLARASLVAVSEGLVWAELAVDPVAGEGQWYLVHDLGRPDRADHVLGLGGAGATLARITPRNACRRVLDLGCGSGIQTLHAAQHAQTVVATDTNPRALHLTAMSAALSQVPQERLDLRQGSLFDPVAGQEFDLIVANPPFVISPDQRFTYRDAGLPGDQLSREAVRGAASHLAAGGTAALLVNWLLRAEEDWSARVADWVADLGVSSWIVVRQVSSVLDYSLLWLRDAGTDPAAGDGAAAGTDLAVWLEHFAALAADAVCLGWVILHRPAAVENPKWLLSEDLAAADRLPDASEVADFLTACDRVERSGLVDLLARPANLVPGTHISWNATIGQLGLQAPDRPARASWPGRIGPQGWRPEVPIDQVVLAALLGPAHIPIGERLDAAAEQAGLDPLDILPSALFSLRDLDRAGLLARA